MRLTPTFLFVSLISFLVPSVVAAVNASPSRTVAARQHRQKRALLDVCADLGLSTILGIELKVCLCLSTLPLALESNIALKALGLDLKVLTGLITKNGQHCTYPPHSHAICTAKDPCGFECTDGYVKVGKTCACPLPRIECRGKCALSCPSPVPMNKRESVGGHQSKKIARTVDLGGLGNLDLNLGLDALGTTTIVTTDKRRDILSPILSGLGLGSTTHHHSGSDIMIATKDLIKYTNRLYQDLVTLTVTAADDTTTVYTKSLVALYCQSLISATVVTISSSTTTSELTTNLLKVLNLDELLATSLAALGAQGSLWQDTKDILRVTLALLDLCDPASAPHTHHHTHPPSPSTSTWPPHPTGTVAVPSPLPSPSANAPIDIDLTPLLHSLSLGGDLGAKLDLDGLLGTKGLNDLLNGLLASLGLGGNPHMPAPGTPASPPPSGDTLLGLDLVALVSSLLNLDLDLGLLLNLGGATDYSGLLSAVGKLNNDLIAYTVNATDETLALTDSALKATGKLLHDLEGCGCAENHDTMSSLLGLKSSLLGNSPSLLKPDI
ncbi:hypothetical protein ONZ45_g4314 [Pleurotus djamor]|nr:hypothetical protein ONZ45_g4314 [Pleurotus djamor]